MPPRSLLVGSRPRGSGTPLPVRRGPVAVEVTTTGRNAARVHRPSRTEEGPVVSKVQRVWGRPPERGPRAPPRPWSILSAQGVTPGGPGGRSDLCPL